jgi:microcin C transport system permease protein
VFENLGGKKERQIFFPIVHEPTLEELGITDAFVLDYQDIIQNNPHLHWHLSAPNPWGPDTQDENILAAPSKTHWLGTDSLGRDIVARLFYGANISLSFAFILWIISYAVGVSLGIFQAYVIGPFDFFLERFKELASIIPMLTIVILVTGITKNQSFSLILFLVLLFAWIGIASQMRAQVLVARNLTYCEAARAMGASHRRIIFRHILPNVMTPIITLTPFALEAGISILATLDYLGFGLPPPTPSLGELLAQGRTQLQNAPWVIASPIVLLVMLLLSLSLIGQGLRAAFDPKSG